MYRHKILFNINLVYLLIIITGFISCKKVLDVDAPNQLISSKVFENDNTADAATAAMYTNWSNNIYLTQSMGLIGNLASDELLSNDASTDIPYMNNAILPTDGTIAGVWQELYNTIYQSNALIEGVRGSGQISASLARQIMGEAFFMRAFSYFYLVNLWGPIPLVTSTDVTISSVQARSDISLVYSQMIADARMAEDSLSEAYPTDEKVRANKWAAASLLSRIYLFAGKYDSAAMEASKVINSGLYSLDPDLGGTFLANSNESILQVWQKYGFVAASRKYIPYGTTPLYYLHPSLINVFQTGDLRFQDWSYPLDNNGDPEYVMYKYHNKTITSGATAEYLMLMRLSEQYLIRAEADIELGDLSGGINDLNLIRNKAGLTSLPDTLTKEEAKSAVIQERRTELFCEWFDRWLTLKRTNTADSVLGILKPNTWKTTAQLWPIPEVEIANNHLLTQNPGY